MSAEVTRQQAEATLAALKAKYADDLRLGLYYEPKLIENWGYPESGPKPFAIVWEEGPTEWALRFPAGGMAGFGAVMESPVALPEGVWVEAYSEWAVAIYPR
jgi:hypothetical protein